MDHQRSAALFQKAKTLLPGGVNSPVRAFRGVGGDPVFFERGEGAWLWDVDGNRYVDYVGSWGPLILGHAHPAVVEAVCEAARKGTSFGAPHAGEVTFAQAVQRFFPSMEKLRMVSSGTEATAAAVRLARGATGRDAVLKFEGCYHGAADAFLVKAGSGVETLGLPDSPGVPAGVAALTLTAPFNDLAAVEALFAKRGGEVACVILEPVVGNMGVLLPREGFLQGLRALCDRHGALLVFDEVMTGFRVSKHGAQGRFGVRPDLTTLGKVIGGGLPVGAYGGRAELMSLIAPEGPVYQAGTLSGNPLAVAAGAACLRALEDEGVFERMERTCALLCEGLRAEAKAASVPLTVNQVGTMWTAFFCEGPVFDYPSAKKADTARFARFYHHLLDAGVYLPPSQFEAGFVSLAHGEAELDHTLSAVKKALRALGD
jgi:glutamate-1-semialdehyde 2,1-aminomutase